MFRAAQAAAVLWKEHVQEVELSEVEQTRPGAAQAAVDRHFYWGR